LTEKKYRENEGDRSTGGTRGATRQPKRKVNWIFGERRRIKLKKDTYDEGRGGEGGGNEEDSCAINL
jgi:hypothetical protein